MNSNGYNDSLFKGSSGSLPISINPPDFFEIAFDAILTALKCDRASILVFDDSGVMRFVAWRGLSADYRRVTDGHSPWGPDEKNPAPVCFDDIDSADLDDTLKVVIRAEGINSLAFIPLVFDGKLIGKFMIYFNTPHAFTANEVDLSLTIAHQLAFGIQRRRGEEALRASEALYRAIARSIPDGRVFVVDKNMRYLVAEGAVISGFGFSKEMLEGHTVSEVFDEEVSNRMKERFQRTFSGETMRFETLRNGRFFWTQSAPMLDSPGHAIAITIDITERKHAEEALRESERQLQILNESLEQKVREQTAEVRNLASNLTKAEQRERYRIAHILHDDL